MIGGVRHSHSYPEVELPLRTKIDVNCGDKLLLLLAQWVEARQRTVSRVIFQASCNAFREAECHFKIGRKLNSAIHVRTMPGAVKCGIETQVPSPELTIDNWANLPSPGVRRKLPPLVADFIREAHSHRPMPRFGNSKSGPNVIAYPIPMPIRLNTGENVKTGLEP